MILLHHCPTPTGDVTVMLHKADGSVSYRKGGLIQTRMDARGRNLAPHIDRAVALLGCERGRRVLVLGHGGGMATRLLHALGVEVVSVDRDPVADRLGRLFFRAPPAARVLVEDAAHYVADATGASFDGVFVDFQDGVDTPAAYRDLTFWRDLIRITRPGGFVVLALSVSLYAGADWPLVQRAMTQAGFDSDAVTPESAPGWRLLITTMTRAGVNRPPHPRPEEAGHTAS